jgi:flagellar protein FliS
MMPFHRGAAQYAAVRNHGVVAEASPTRLVQIVFEHILAELATAQGCMQRIENDLPLPEVIAKGKAIGKAVRLVNQLDASLDMERGGEIAANLRSLYAYMLTRLTVANATNDPTILVEVAALVRKIKSGWDQIVSEKQ